MIRRRSTAPVAAAAGPDAGGAGALSARAFPLHILPPGMLRLEAEHLLGLAVREQGLVFAELALHLDPRIEALQELRRRQVGGAILVADVEHLEAEPVLLQAQAHHLAEIAGVDIAPHDALAAARIG